MFLVTYLTGVVKSWFYWPMIAGVVFLWKYKRAKRRFEEEHPGQVAMAWPIDEQVRTAVKYGYTLYWQTNGALSWGKGRDTHSTPNFSFVCNKVLTTPARTAYIACVLCWSIALVEHY